jgi:hypothetical protein
MYLVAITRKDGLKYLLMSTYKSRVPLYWSTLNQLKEDMKPRLEYLSSMELQVIRYEFIPKRLLEEIAVVPVQVFKLINGPVQVFVTPVTDMVNLYLWQCPELKYWPQNNPLLDAMW